jgi:rhodanese-related sulfurtransferase
MINTLKKIFGLGPATNYKELLQKGAQVIDVRTPAEYASGHIRGSINIPLNDLQSKAKKIKSNTPLITCCASGMRSAAAKGVLKQMGHADVYNGGSWTSLNRKLKG